MAERYSVNIERYTFSNDGGKTVGVGYCVQSFWDDGDAGSPEFREDSIYEAVARASTLAWSMEFAERTPQCPGCGIRELHKMCPAHGTPVYMNPSHPEWGKATAERLDQMRDARE